MKEAAAQVTLQPHAQEGLVPMRPQHTLQQRFWSKVNKNGPIPIYAPRLGCCWLWTASTNGWGYGRFKDNTRLVGAHRWAYESVNGPIPEGLQLDHLCRTRLCVRSSHLEAVTCQVNLLRGISPAGRTIASKNAATTHCPQGHPYDLFNTMWGDTQQGRKCRKCANEWQRQKRLRVRLLSPS